MPPTYRGLPSLGETEKSELVLTRFEVDLPASRQEIISTIESILVKGGVQKVVVEIGHPIQVTRLVDKASISAPQEELPDDFWNQVRNSRIEELDTSRYDNGYVYLFHAFALLMIRKLKPKMLFCHDHEQLRKWLKLKDIFPVDHIYGTETAPRADVPEDAVILAATSYDEVEVLGIRIPVDIQEPQATVTALPKKGRS